MRMEVLRMMQGPDLWSESQLRVVSSFTGIVQVYSNKKIFKSKVNSFVSQEIHLEPKNNLKYLRTYFIDNSYTLVGQFPVSASSLSNSQEEADL